MKLQSEHGCRTKVELAPNDNADLISIALMTNSSLLLDNIDKVRDSIRIMVGWRMKAADFIVDKIKSQVQDIAVSSIINMEIFLKGLGHVIILKVIEVSSEHENIDIKYVNRLLQKDII